MSSLLENFRSQTNIQPEDYRKLEEECPAVSKRLLVYLDKMFQRRIISPTSISMQQELVYQAGIDKVKDHLRSQNARQEGAIQAERTKNS